jgi:DNA polymerase-3 subunit delta'
MLSAAEVGRVLESVAGSDVQPDPRTLERAAAAADGSAGRALALLAPKTLALLDEVQSLLEALPNSSPRRVLALAERLTQKQAGAEFGLALDHVQAWAANAVSARAGLGAARLAPLAEVCENLEEAARSVETYNLDRRPLIVSIFADLAEAVRRTV